jgi:hypothetical protein
VCVNHELEIIKIDLHYNSVRIQDLDIDRVKKASEDALVRVTMCGTGLSSYNQNTACRVVYDSLRDTTKDQLLETAQPSAAHNYKIDSILLCVI